MCGKTPGEIDPDTAARCGSILAHQGQELGARMNCRTFALFAPTCKQGAKNVTSEKQRRFGSSAKSGAPVRKEQRAVFDCSGPSSGE